ncbi:hypothetical protein WA026_022951, partial [Henosepilachna vigintioctopunctata]
LTDVDQCSCGLAETSDHVLKVCNVYHWQREIHGVLELEDLNVPNEQILTEPICSGAKTLVLKKDPVLPVTNHEITSKNIKQFQELVDKSWKFEMGSLALKDSNEKFSMTPTKISISKDILLFKNYCHSIANHARSTSKVPLVLTNIIIK